MTNDMTQMFSTKPVLLVFTVQMVQSKPLSSLVLWVHSATYLVCRMSQNVLLVLVATTVMNLGRQHTLSCVQKVRKEQEQYEGFMARKKMMSLLVTNLGQFCANNVSSLDIYHSYSVRRRSVFSR